jgi:hypothetical protein
MRKSNKKKHSRFSKRGSGLRHDYNVLEERRMLAVLTELDAVTGQLTITISGPAMSFYETATVDIDAGLVTVNGNSDLDSNMPGMQTLSYSDLRSIVVIGDATINDQIVEFRGDFSSANGANLQTISVTDINSVFILGNYELAGDFVATLDGVGGGINDGSSGRLVVGGITSIDAGDNPVVLNNDLNDFVGSVSLQLTDDSVGYSAWIHDANDIEFDNVMIARSLRVTAGGEITDTDDSVISIGDLGSFSGASIALGNNTSGLTEIFRVTLNATGHAELYLDSAVMFTGMNRLGSLEVDTSLGIFDGQKTSINVMGLASFSATETIRLGDLPYDIFNAGSLNFNSEGLVEISENSSMQIAGDNTAQSANLQSQGDITDADDALINVDLVARFQANNVIIGDTATDQFNAGSVQFNVDGNMYLTEDSGTHLVESSYANRFELVSNGPISDADDAQIEIVTLASFDGSSITIGDTATDSFRTGWLTFKSLQSSFISEDDATIIANLNTAESATIVSMGSIINIDLARIFITGEASFSGTEITLGNRTDDVLRFGGLSLNSAGVATIFEDEATMFVGTTSVAELRMNSVGSITDAATASINVAGAAIFYSETAGVRLGDTATDEFNAGSLTIDTVNGIANITENSDIFLTGINQARSLVLNAQGSISDDAFASIDLEFLLSVTGTDVDLGDAATDVLRFGSLTFNTGGDTRISSQETIILTGASAAGGAMVLTSEGNIFDSVDAQTSAGSADLTAIDIVLGDTATDCFDVLPANTVTAASGSVSITYGC